jgi:hypothetical protein
MSTGPAVIVNKGGFFGALARGLFGAVITVVICGTALGVYGLHLADKHLSGLTRQVMTALPQWQQILPPVLADALNDRRAPEYRESLDITSRYVPNARDSGRGALLIDVQNKGTQTVSLLTLHMVVEDQSDERFYELSTAVATPLSIADHRGPLPPGSSREIVQRLWHVAGAPQVKVEVNELRVWNGPTPQPDAKTPSAPEGTAERSGGESPAS